MSHQRGGYFGLTPDGQQLHRARVDINRALAASASTLQLWSTVKAHAPAPAFSGGVMDAWPAWAVDALAVAHEESNACRAYFAAVKQKEREPRHA